MKEGEKEEDYFGQEEWVLVEWMGIRADPSLLEGSGTDNSVSELTLPNNLLYNLHFFVQELVYLVKNSLLKIACIE